MLNFLEIYRLYEISRRLTKDVPLQNIQRKQFSIYSDILRITFISNNRTRVSRRFDLSSSFNRSAAGDHSLESGTDSDCVEVWDSEVSFTSDGPTVQVAPDPKRRETEAAYNADDEMSVPESAAEQKIASLESELDSLKSQLADILLGMFLPFTAFECVLFYSNYRQGN